MEKIKCYICKKVIGYRKPSDIKISGINASYAEMNDNYGGEIKKGLANYRVCTDCKKENE